MLDRTAKTLRSLLAIGVPWELVDEHGRGLHIDRDIENFLKTRHTQSNVL